MKRILEYKVAPEQAALWFLGQSGFIIKSCDTVIAMDPYLTDSVAEVSPRLTRLFPPPMDPSELKVDIFVVTHDHLDHLDPKTIDAYQHVQSTLFVGPRLACAKLAQLGIPVQNIVKTDVGQSSTAGGVTLTGIYALPNEPAVIDTAGYKFEFANGRSLYHSSDTGMSPLLLAAAPAAEVALICINGQWGNLNIDEAAQLADKVGPRFAIPHHYDLMALNSKNPEAFEYQLKYVNPDIDVRILKVMEPFVW